MTKIREIFEDAKTNYGYRRVTLELKNDGSKVNHKKVKRLMSKMGLFGKRMKKRRYNSYEGVIGKVAGNLIKRDFESDTPMKKCFTDVTEFRIGDEKLYLSPTLDAYNREIVGYSISKRPNFDFIKDMLNNLFDGREDLSGMIIHSDQGWQYQYEGYQKILNEKGIVQSMSRKGNSIDNGLMESFFGVLKREIFYGMEDSYKSVDELRVAIEEYIEYYNNSRIKVKLGGLSPVEYRERFSKTA